MVSKTQEEFLAQRHKKEPLMALAITTLMSPGVFRTVLGISFLVILQQEMGIIHSQLIVTLEKTETALHYLQKSVDFLARITLQNRRDLTLLFMEQGGI